ncbi:MAG: hypothetical protein ACXVDD_18020 [Polyangia bacterium]
MTWTISDVIPETLRSFGRNWVTLVVGNLVAMLIIFSPVIVCAAVTMPMIFAQAADQSQTHELVLGGTVIALLFAFIGTVVLGIMFAPALSRIALAAARGQHPRIRDVFDFRRAGTFFGAGLLSALAVMAGMVLLLVPGLIVAIALSFVSFYVVDKPALGATDAIEASWRTTRGHRLRLFGLMLVGALANGILNAIFGSTIWLAPLQIALSLVVGPISTLALAQVYLCLEPQPRGDAQALAA